MTKNKITILIGPPCSGKSTWAKNFIKDNPDYVRINRDSMRDMLKGQYVFDPSIEVMISRLSLSAMNIAANNNRNIIIDNTHCKAKYLIDIIKPFIGHKFTLKFFIEPKWKLKLRNIIRYFKTGVWIPVKIIDNMYDNYIYLSKNIHKELADYLHTIEKIER